MKTLMAVRRLVPQFSVKVLKLLALAVLPILAVPHFASSATFLVNSTADIVDANPGDGKCDTGNITISGQPECTLRAAIMETNFLAGSNTVKLPAGLYRLTIRGPAEQNGATGDLNIFNSLTILGENTDRTIVDGGGTIVDGGVCADVDDPQCTSDNVGSDDDRVFSILNRRPNLTVHISGVTIQNGGTGHDPGGGGIFIDEGTSVVLTNCIIRKNRSREFGGGITNAGFVQIFESTISDNTLPLGDVGGETASGGGIFSIGRMQIHRSTISGNKAVRGGGIRNAGGDRMEITNSTISGNKAITRGGGIMNFGPAFIAYSTITNNETDGRLEDPNAPRDERPPGGGGIYNDPGVSDGTVARVEISSSIVAGNRANGFGGESPDCFSVDSSTFTSFGGNLFGIITPSCTRTATRFSEVFPDNIGGNLQLTPVLGNNGGPTLTHALLTGSAAIDRGVGHTSPTEPEFFDCPETDQRGFRRPGIVSIEDCDSGAFEFGATSPAWR
jgi:large repetitive protein